MTVTRHFDNHWHRKYIMNSANSLLRCRGRWVWVAGWKCLFLWLHNVTWGQRQRGSRLSSGPEACPQLIHKPVTCRYEKKTNKKKHHKHITIQHCIYLVSCFKLVPRETASSSRVRPERSSAGCWLTSATALRGTVSSSMALEKPGQRRNVSRTAHSTK